MNKRAAPSRLEKARARKRADEAVAYIIAHRQMGYVKTALKFNVSPEQIRARIEHRYGTLAAARAGQGGAVVAKRRTRKCIVCKEEGTFDVNTYICRSCKKQTAGIHDGRV